MKRFKLSIQTLLCAVLLLGSSVGLVQVWVKHRQSVIKLDDQKLTTASISPDGKKIIVHFEIWGSENKIFRVLDFDAQNELLTPQFSLGLSSLERIESIRFSRDNSRVYIVAQTMTHVIAVADGKGRLLRGVHGRQIGKSENGQYVARVVDPGTVILGDAEGKTICQFPDSSNPVDLAAVVANDGKYLVTSGQGLRLRDSAGNEIALLDQSNSRLVVFSPDNNRVMASIHRDGVHCWDVPSGKKLFSLKKGLYSEGVFSADGTRIYTTVHMQDLHPDNLFIEVWDASTGAALPRLGPFDDRPAVWRDSTTGFYSVRRFYSDDLYDFTNGRLGAIDGWHNNSVPILSSDLQWMVSQTKYPPFPVWVFESPDADLWVRNAAKTEWSRWRPAHVIWTRRFFIFFTLLMLALLVRSVRRDRASWRAAEALANAPKY